MKDRSLIICSNTYTLYNAIKIALAQKQNFDLLYIINDGYFFSNYKFYIKNYSKYLNYIENIKKLKIFKNVYFYFNKNSFIVRKILYFFPFIFSLYILHSLKSKKFFPYRNIYSPNRIFGIILNQIVKHSNFYLYDEGFSSYTGLNDNEINRKYSFIKNLFYKIKIKKILLNEIKIYYKKNKKIIPLPKIKKNNYFNFNEIFNYKKNKLYKNIRIVYFPNLPRGIVSLINSKVSTIKKKKLINHVTFIEKIIVEKLTNFNCIYRNSPIIKEIPNLKNFKKDQLLNSWELECQNSITNKHILISIVSTTMLIPKILFNKEPYLIFLNKLICQDIYNANKVILNLKKIYKNKKKILQPKNISEFEKILTSINN